MMTRSRLRSAHQIQSVFVEPLPPADENDSESDSELPEEIIEVSEHESEEVADSEEEEDDEPVSGAQRKRCRPSFLKSKIGFSWSTDAPDVRGRRSQTILNPSPKGAALNVSTPLEAWSVLMTDNILESIVTHTNEQIARAVRNRETLNTYEKNIDLIELKSLIGLLYYVGLFKLCKTNPVNLWSVHSMPIFSCVMPRQRFEFLIQNLRFDDKNTRNDRKATDRLAPIREIWDLFITNCKENYEPGTNVTIDEQLLSFRGRCSFIIYIPSKPDKYGIKVVAINDAQTHYLFDAIPYCGPVNKEANESVPSYYVRELTKSIYNSGRNITCDNWFTSVPICDKLRTDYNLTLVGTIRKNKREIPPSFKQAAKDNQSARFAYKDRKVLCFNPKPKKHVLLLSSLHTTGKIDEKTGKPEIVVFYNKTKGRTDSFDQKCHNYTTVRRTARWPLRFFYGMLDQAGVNSCIWLSLLADNALMKRSTFLLELSMSLVKPALSRRLLIQTLRTSLREKIKTFLDDSEINEEEDVRDLFADNKMEKQKRCGYCPASLDRKTNYKCLKCDAPMCRDHVAKICQTCAK